MTGVASKFVGSGYTKKFLKGTIGKLHEVASGVKNAMAGGFRKAGKCPEDKSGFPQGEAK